ncbi:MAG: M56 family metallopeptidase, partial [Flavicella sp.]
WTIYWIGLVFFGGRFWKNLISIISEIRKNSKVEKQYYQYVLLYRKVIPHTFLKYIFLNKSDFECNSIPKEVLLHEQAHADQRHSIDIICIEILQVIFWFNPLIYLIKKSIKLNHEFLADEAVLSEGVETSQYQKMLLTFSTKTTTPIFTNSINYSIIKKRFTLMKAKKSKNKTWFKGLLVLPLVAILTFSFSTKETIKFQDETSLEIDVQEGATRAQIKEYNKLAKHYNATNPTSMFIKILDVKRLTYLYGLMTERQIKKVEAFPNFPPPPPAPNKEKETIFVKIGVNDKDPNSPPPPPKRTIK